MPQTSRIGREKMLGKGHRRAAFSILSESKEEVSHEWNIERRDGQRWETTESDEQCMMRFPENSDCHVYPNMTLLECNRCAESCARSKSPKRSVEFSKCSYIRRNSS